MKLFTSQVRPAAWLRCLARAVAALAWSGAAATSAAADLRLIQWDPATVDARSLSGARGSQNDTREPGANAVLYGLVFDERGDKPCYLELHWWRLSDDNVRQNFTTRFDICKDPPKGDKSLVLSDAVADRLAVRSLAVCTNKKGNTRLKGARIAAATIDHNGSGSAQPAGASLDEDFARTNCSDWHAASTCAAGAVAVGVQIAHSGEEIQGLGLRCAKAVVKVVVAPTTARFAEMERSLVVNTEDGAKTMTIAQAIKVHKVAGATVVTIADGKIDAVGHYGLRDFNDNLPTTSQTVYQAASTSKFIAALGMVKAARTKAGPALDEPVTRLANAAEGELLDDWVRRKFGKKEADYPADITPRRLLSHTAGLSVDSIGTSNINGYTDMRNILIGDALVGRSGTKPLFAPGTAYEYSGGGFTVAEAMLEAKSGRSARAYLNDEVLQAYGMTRSTFDTADKGMSNLARGCSKSPCLYDVWSTQVKFAGGLLAHPQDYANLLLLVLNGGKDAGGRQVIPWDDLKEVMTPGAHKDSSLAICTASTTCKSGEQCLSGRCRRPIVSDGEWYGLGVSLSTGLFEGYPQTLSHSGDHPGFRTSFVLDRKNRMGLVVMINGDGEWKNGGVTFGGQALLNDIRDAFWKAY